MSSGNRLIQEEIDRRFSRLERLMDERRDNARRDDQFIQEEIDRRVYDLKELIGLGQSAAKEAVQAALTAAKEAVTVAQTASEKRFDGVNEFRKTLTDQTNTFVPRTENDTQLKSLGDRVTANSDRVGALELRLTSRLDTFSGEKTGSSESRTQDRDHRTQATSTTVMILVAVSTFVSVAALVLSIVLSAHP